MIPSLSSDYQFSWEKDLSPKQKKNKQKQWNVILPFKDTENI